MLAVDLHQVEGLGAVGAMEGLEAGETEDGHHEVADGGLILHYQHSRFEFLHQVPAAVARLVRLVRPIPQAASALAFRASFIFSMDSLTRFSTASRLKSRMPKSFIRLMPV